MQNIGSFSFCNLFNVYCQTSKTLIAVLMIKHSCLYIDEYCICFCLPHFFVITYQRWYK